MPIKTGSYTMSFMINTGVPPFETYDATLNITSAPSIAGDITILKLGIQGVSITGTSMDNNMGITTFTFSTPPNVFPQLSSYGMQILCGTAMKLMGGTNITNTARLAGADPTEDACWLATHSVGEGDDDDDDKHGKGKYGS